VRGNDIDEWIRFLSGRRTFHGNDDGADLRPFGSPVKILEIIPQRQVCSLDLMLQRVRFQSNIRRFPVLCFEQEDSGRADNDVIDLAVFDVFASLLPVDRPVEMDIDIVDDMIFSWQLGKDADDKFLAIGPDKECFVLVNEPKRAGDIVAFVTDYDILRVDLGHLIMPDQIQFPYIPFQGAVDMMVSQGHGNPIIQPAPRPSEKTFSVPESGIPFVNLLVYDRSLPGDGFIELLPEPGFIVGEPDDNLIVLPAERCLRLCDDLITMVVQVMQFIDGCQVLSLNWPGSFEEVFCAAGDTVDAGHGGKSLNSQYVTSADISCTSSRV